MARINIEDCWWTDPRRKALARKFGEESQADGCAVNAWRTAQEYWKHGRILIPSHIWSLLPGAAEMVEIGLAEVRPDGVYVRGSCQYLEWVLERHQAAKKGGERSAKIRRERTGSAVPKNAPNSPKQNRSNVEADTEATPNQTQPSVSGSSSVSSSGSKIPLRGQAAAPPAIQGGLALVSSGGTGLPAPLTKRSKYSDETRAKMQAFIAAYSTAYREKYGGPPEGVREPAIIGKLGHWIAHTSQDRAVNLVQVYLQITHRQIDDSCHDLWGFFRHLNRIGNALSTGQDPGQINWAKVFGGAG